MLLTKINLCYTTKALQTFLILFNTLIFISCKKEVISPDNGQKKLSNEFRERLYAELLKKDETRLLVNKLPSSEKLDWERALIRISSNISQPINYELPIVAIDGTCKRVIEFAFSKDKELVNIRLREFNAELSKRKSTIIPLSENERTNNILHFLSKSGLKIDPSITSAKGEKIIDTKSPSKISNTTIALPTKSSTTTTRKYVELKPSNSVQYTYPRPPMPDTVHCATTVDYDFYFDFGRLVPESQSLEIASTLNYFFFQHLNAQGLPYGDDVRYRNEIYFLNNYSPVEHLENIIRDCIYYAVQSTQGYYADYLWGSGIQYMNINSQSNCVIVPEPIDYSMTEAEATIYINSLENQNTGDGIEFYLLALYRASKILNLSKFSVANNSIQAGPYTLVPHYSSSNQLVFFAATRYGNKGIEYIIRADNLANFQSRVSYYTAAADLFYLNGIPSEGQVMMMTGDYFNGLLNLWSNSLKSPEYWLYLGTLYITGSSNNSVKNSVLRTVKNDISASEYTFTQTAEAHLGDIVKRGANAGQMSRPYMNSPLTINQIMSTGPGIPDATFPGGYNWRVPGNFRGSNGSWELGINPQTKVIYHFNFTY